MGTIFIVVEISTQTYYITQIHKAFKKEKDAIKYIQTKYKCNKYETTDMSVIEVPLFTEVKSFIEGYNNPNS